MGGRLSRRVPVKDQRSSDRFMRSQEDLNRLPVPLDLERFVDAQASVYEQRGGARRRAKTVALDVVHLSADSRTGVESDGTAHFAIAGIDEAIAYLNHPVLGARLHECTGLVLAVEGRSVSEIFGYPDDLKFHSSVTLFAAAAKRNPTANGDDHVFQDVLTKYFGGEPDQATLVRL